MYIIKLITQVKQNIIDKPKMKTEFNKYGSKQPLIIH